MNIKAYINAHLKFNLHILFEDFASHVWKDVYVSLDLYSESFEWNIDIWNVEIVYKRILFALKPMSVAKEMNWIK